MANFGEIAFVMLGLKCCCLMTSLLYLPSSFAQNFCDTVILPSGLLQLRDSEGNALVELLQVKSEKRTPNCELSSCLAIINPSHGLTQKARSLLLDGTVREISEADIAAILDYPYALPDSEEQIDSTTAEMMEVAYVTTQHQQQQQQSQQQPQTEQLAELFTSYGCPQPLIQSRALPHFKRYRDVALQQLNVQLKIVLTVA